jgi:H+-translocating NAD(P) transhydrogenase subunit beta
MPPSYVMVAWLVAAVCFILSLGGLAKHETARRGNLLGIIGITIAIVAAFFSGLGGIVWILIAIAIGATIGLVIATRVQMTSMPQLVAMLHSFVGLAAVLVGIASYNNSAEMLAADSLAAMEKAMGSHGMSSEITIHLIEIFIGVFIGGITFTGSLVAFGKLDERISSKPLMLPNRHLLNAGGIAVCLLLGLWFLMVNSTGIGMIPLILMTLISFAIGAHLVMAIGGADMPVVVSMLNSYSGWAAAATGFLLKNDLLIITGALVGSSGAILSYIMCRAMNRSFISVILGGFGSDGSSASSAKDTSGVKLTWNEQSASEVAAGLADSRNVIVIPGYGMAVAQAQHAVREIAEILKQRGVRTRFAIHPVAGRLPGHMNVLLAEARVPYDVVLEMDEINEDFPDTDMVLVIGANDIVNPSAQDDPGSPIYGMPVLEAWKARQVIILKRSMGSGYSGIDNPLFYKENSAMLFGDAKASVEGVLKHLREAVTAGH